MPNPICPTGCSPNLPPVAFDLCNPVTYDSEIQDLFIAKSTASDFTDVTDAAEWMTRLSQTSTTGDDYIRQLTIIGDKPAPTATDKELSKRRKKRTNKTHILNVTMDEATPENHEFIRHMECGGRFKIWYKIEGGLLFGGNTGIKNAQLFLDMLLNRGEGEILTYGGTVEWKNAFTEEYVVSPI